MLSGDNIGCERVKTRGLSREKPDHDDILDFAEMLATNI